MRQLLLILATLAAFGQATTPYKVSQSSGSLAGQIWLQEPRSGGTNWLKLRAGTLAADVDFTLPTADGSTGQCLQTDGAGQWQWGACGGGSAILATDYDWSQEPGGSLSVGANTISLAPCPEGVAASTTYYNIRISGGTGTAETVRVTGGTCTSGAASGTLEFTAVNTHTGPWSASSASDGIQEAAIVAGSGGVVRIPSSTLTIDPPAPNSPSTNVYLPQPIQIIGNGYAQYGYSMINVLGEQWAFYFLNPYASIVRDLYIIGTGTATSGGGMYFTEATTHNCESIVENVILQNLYNGIWFDKQCASQIRGVRTFNIDNHHLHLENDWGTDYGDTLVSGNFFQEDDNEGTCIYWVNGGGGRIIANKFLGCAVGIDAQFTAASGGASFDSTSIAAIIGNSFDQNTEAGIRFDGTIPFDGLVISGNVITPKTFEASFIGIDYGNTGGTTYFDNATISGNTINCRTTTNYTAIKIRRANNTTIDANNIIGCQIGVQAGANAANLGIGKNDMGSVTTPYDISMSATMAPNGQLRQISSAFNIWTLAEFTQASGAANSAILFGNPTTGTTSQRGLWWGYNDKDLNFARFDSAGSAGPSTDLTIEADGDTKVIRNLGIGVSPTVPLDVVGAVKTTSTVTAGSYVASVVSGKEIRIQGNYSGAVGVGSMTADPMLMLVDSAERFRFTTSALLPATTDSYTLGSTSARVLATYSKIFDSVVSGGTGDYMQTRKLQLFDNTGSSTGASFWDLNVVMSGVGAGQNSYFYLRDNGGNTVWRADKIASGATVATTTIYTDLLPDSTANVRDLGKTTQRWDEINGASLDLSGAANISGNLSAAVINATGSPAYRVNGTTVINASREATFVGLTIPTGAASGYLWTSDGSGVGSWQAAAGVTAPLTLTLGAAGYSEPLIVANSTNGAYGACMAMAATDTSTSTVYTAGRICGRYDSGSFADELVTIQTASGVGAYDVAMAFKNQAVTMPGTLDVTGNISGAVINATGSPAYRVSGTTVINASREATFAGLTIATGAVSGYVWTSDGSGVGSWQAGGGGWTVSGSDVYRSTGVVTIGHTSPTVRLGQNLNVNYASDYAGMAINTWSATDGHGGVIDLNKSGSGTIGTHAAVVSGETLGFVVFRGSDGTAFQRAAQINGEVDGTVSSGVVPGRILLRTASTSGVMAERLRIDSAGLASFSAGVDITGNLSAAVINATGSPAYRVSGTTVINASRDATFVGLTTSGAVSLASSTITASSTFSSDLIATTGSTYALGSNAVRWLAYLNSTNINGTVTLNGTITGDILPTSNNTYINGSSSAYWNQVASETFYVENSGRIRPRTANTGSVGISSARFNKGWFTDMDITGTITPPSGTAFSGTKTVRDAAGTGTCTLTFSSGIMTGGTC
jgi:hypothetical protein